MVVIFNLAWKACAISGGTTGAPTAKERCHDTPLKEFLQELIEAGSSMPCDNLIRDIGIEASTTAESLEGDPKDLSILRAVGNIPFAPMSLAPEHTDHGDHGDVAKNMVILAAYSLTPDGEL